MAREAEVTGDAAGLGARRFWARLGAEEIPPVIHDGIPAHEVLSLQGLVVVVECVHDFAVLLLLLLLLLTVVQPAAHLVQGWSSLTTEY